MASSMASIGLTVALFIAGEAYQQEQLQAEAKMGALLSGLMGGICILFSRSPLWARLAKRIPWAFKLRIMNKVRVAPPHHRIYA